jgi:hypothetical protein
MMSLQKIKVDMLRVDAYMIKMKKLGGGFTEITLSVCPFVQTHVLYSIC